MKPGSISDKNPIDELYREFVLKETPGETLLKKGSTTIVQHLTSGHPVSAILAETIGPVFVDATIEEVPRYADDYVRFQRGQEPRKNLRPGEYYVENMNKLFDTILTKPLKPIVKWFKDLLRRDAERASTFLHR